MIRCEAGRVIRLIASTVSSSIFRFISDIQIFGIFPEDNQIDIFVPGFHAFQRTGWPDVRVQVKRQTQLDVDAAEALTNRRRAWRFKCNVILRIDCSVASGIRLPVCSSAVCPSVWRSKVRGSWSACKTRTTGRRISGPIPSPSTK